PQVPDHLPDGSRRHPHDRAGNARRRGGLPDQAVRRRRAAGRTAAGHRSGPALSNRERSYWNATSKPFWVVLPAPLIIVANGTHTPTPTGPKTLMSAMGL